MLPNHSEHQDTLDHSHRLVIAGASGLIGTALCRELAADYEKVPATSMDAFTD